MELESGRGFYLVLFLCGVELIAVRAHDFSLPLAMVNGAQTSVQLPQILRKERQASSVCSFEELSQRLARVQCDASYLNALRNVENAECSYPITFR